MAHAEPPVGAGIGGIAQRALRVVATSRINYWLAYVVDLGCAALLAWAGLRAVSGPWVPFLSAVTGMLLFTFVEYAMHRWLFHAPASFATVVHARHHHSPRQPVANPFPSSAAAVVLFWPPLSWVFGTQVASCGFSGLLLGYFSYGLLHHLEHHVPRSRVPSAWLRRVWETHATHHARPDRNYGVTTSFWDRLFGTYHPAVRAPTGRLAAQAGDPGDGWRRRWVSARKRRTGSPISS